MELKNAIITRHSVRQYLDKNIEGDILELLSSYIEKCSLESGLDIRLVLNDEKAFDCFLSHYGKFSGVRNYIAFVGKKGKELYEAIGYYGEKIVLYAQSLGLNTCWVALTYKKTDSVEVKRGEKIHVVISVGYGKNQGKPRSSKRFSEVCEGNKHPEWFIKGVEGALLAPTAINQQKFCFIRDGNIVFVKSGVGLYSKMDLGIIKLHFELCAGKENFIWGK